MQSICSSARRNGHACSVQLLRISIASQPLEDLLLLPWAQTKVCTVLPAVELPLRSGFPCYMCRLELSEVITECICCRVLNNWSREAWHWGVLLSTALLFSWPALGETCAAFGAGVFEFALGDVSSRIVYMTLRSTEVWALQET